jgi:hypothetical protein
MSPAQAGPGTVNPVDIFTPTSSVERSYRLQTELVKQTTPPPTQMYESFPGQQEQLKQQSQYQEQLQQQQIQPQPQFHQQQQPQQSVPQFEQTPQVQQPQQPQEQLPTTPLPTQGYASPDSIPATAANGINNANIDDALLEELLNMGDADEWTLERQFPELAQAQRQEQAFQEQQRQQKELQQRQLKQLQQQQHQQQLAQLQLQLEGQGQQPQYQNSECQNPGRIQYSMPQGNLQQAGLQPGHPQTAPTFIKSDPEGFQNIYQPHTPGLDLSDNSTPFQQAYSSGPSNFNTPNTQLTEPVSNYAATSPSNQGPSPGQESG